jgi:hypothetical protein
MNLSNVKIAVVFPIGSIEKFGYQYQTKNILNILSDSFDKVIIASTTRETKKLPVEKENIELITDETLMFQLDNNKEIFSIYTLYNAEKKCMDVAKKQGFDFVVRMSINMYIDKCNEIKMRKYCEKLKKEDKPYGFSAKAFQLKDLICYPNTLLPIVINLKHLDQFKFDIDVLEYQNKRISWQGGLHKNSDFFIIDVFAIETEKDFKEKYNWYIKSYMKEWQSKDIGPFNYENEKNKVLNKLNKLVVNKEYNYTEINKQIENNYQKESIINKINIDYSNYSTVLIKSYLIKILKVIGIYKYLGNR